MSLRWEVSLGGNQGAKIFTPSFMLHLCTDQNSQAVTIALIVLVILGFVAIAGCLAYVYWSQNRGASYHVASRMNQPGSWMSLRPRVVGEDAS